MDVAEMAIAHGKAAQPKRDLAGIGARTEAHQARAKTIPFATSGAK
jgi:hypothetical protein